MKRSVLPLLLSLAGLAALGCQNDRPQPFSPEHAMEFYKSDLAGTCADKHMDQLPASEFAHFAKGYYVDADTQTQQLIDLDTKRACGNKETDDCYRLGFLTASEQAGGIDEVVKHVCSMPFKCTGQGQCAPSGNVQEAEGGKGPA